MPDPLQQIIETQMSSLEEGELSSFRLRMSELLGQAERMEIVDQESYSRGGDLVKIISNDVRALDEARLEQTEKPREYVSWVNAEFKKITGPLNAAASAAKAKMKKWADEEAARRAEEERVAREKAEAAALAAAEKAEAARKEAEEKAAAARLAAETAEAAGDDDAAAIASEAASEAEDEAFEHQQEAENVIDQAANAPEVDTTVRRQRGSFGSTSGMRKVWKVEIVDLLDFLVDADPFLVNLVVNDQKVKAAVLTAIKQTAIATVKGGGEQPSGLKVYQDSEVSVR